MRVIFFFVNTFEARCFGVVGRRQVGGDYSHVEAICWQRLVGIAGGSIIPSAIQI